MHFAGSNLSRDPKCPKIFVFSHPNHAEGVYIINSVGIAYHQCEALYIIKPQVDARWRVMRYSPEGADDMHDCVVMIYQACGLDKKILVPKNEDFLSHNYDLDDGVFRSSDNMI